MPRRRAAVLRRIERRGDCGGARRLGTDSGTRLEHGESLATAGSDEIARGLTRSHRKLTVTPLRCRDRRLVHRPFGADSLGGGRWLVVGSWLLSADHEMVEDATNHQPPTTNH